MKTIKIDGKSYLIDIEKATDQGLLKEKDSKPRSWEEYDRILKQLYIANAYDKIGVGGTRYDRFATENEAKAFCALGKLIQLLFTWQGDWKPDWNNDSKPKYCIDVEGNEVVINIHYMHYALLVFPTKEMTEEFLNCFRDLIEKAKGLY